MEQIRYLHRGMWSRLVGPSYVEPTWTATVDLLELGARGDTPWLTFHRGREAEHLSTLGALQLAKRWAAGFLQQGVRGGDRVLLVLPNGPDFVGAFFGAQLLGAIPVPAPWAGAQRAGGQFVERRLRPLLASARPRVIASLPGALPHAPIATPLVLGPAEHGLSGDRHQGRSGTAFIQFTSGTSGAPRGAIISQAALVASTVGMGAALGLEPGQAAVSWLPFFHDMGLVGTLLSSLVAGVELHVLAPQEFLLHPERWLVILADTQARVTVAPNFGYGHAARRARLPEATDLGSLQVALNGAEPVLRATQDAFEHRFAPSGLRAGAFRPAYGLAEATLAVSIAGPGGAPDLEVAGRQVPAVGVPTPGTVVEVRSPEGGRVLPAGEEGELWVRGPSLMDGYFEAPEATAKVVNDGWLRTGDLGTISSGALYVTGRKKDLVIKAGQKFFPYEIERIAVEAAGPRAGAAVAFATWDGADGPERLIVVVELPSVELPGAAERVRGEVAGNLGVTPDLVLFVAPGGIPRTTSGKIRRDDCRQLLGSRA